ncbi:hypothetical protein BH10PAT4_BH10PAT4_3830 [soil metagenome]
MEPTTPQQPLSMDYLNKIAPQAPKSKLPFTKKQMIILGILGIAVIIAIILMIVIGGGGIKKYEEQLAARLIGTETIANDSTTKIKSTSMRALNSNLKIYMTNTNRDIAAPLAKDGINTSKLDKTLLTSESGTDANARLEDARLNGVYDRTYAREMAYRLATIVTLMKKIQGSTSNKTLQTFLVSALTNLEPTQKQFSDFNEAAG